MPSLSGTEKEIVALVTLALEQGWSVDPAGQRLAFKPADKSQGIIYLSKRGGNGRGLKNDIAKLQRAGLDVSSLKSYSDSVVDTGESYVVTAKEGGQDELAEAGVAQLMDFVAGNPNHLADLVAGTVVSAEANKAVRDMVADLLAGLRKFHLTIGSGGVDAQLEEAQALYVEADEARKREEQRAEKAEEKVSSLGAELRDALKERDEALERANKAEGRLRQFRAALMDD